MRYPNTVFFLALGLAATSSATAQSTNSPVAATAATVVPTLVRYSGIAVANDGKPKTGETSITFLIYKDEKGGDPLWAETQAVALDPVGHYEVHLGAMNASGLPADLFANGEARWLEVQVAGNASTPRILLASVPYAMNAATLGGLPASAFVLAGSQVAALATAGTAEASSSGVTPDTSNVTTSGGTSKYLTIFTGTSTIGNSEIYDTGTSVGIGDVPNAAAKLDVNGEMIMRGNMQVTRTGSATSSTAYPSYGFEFFSNVYNSSTKATDNPHFQLQSEPTGNNSSTTGATFNLLYSNHGTPAVETGLSINPSGIIHFAGGQTFPGGSGITGVTASSPLTGGGTSGNVSIGLSTSSLESTLNPVYARLAAFNNFTSSANFAGPITGNSGNTQYAIQGNTSSGFGVEGMATGTDGYGVDGYTTGNGGIGVFGNSDGNPDSNGNYPVGVLAHALLGYGVKAVVDEPSNGLAAALALNGGGSATYQFLKGTTDYAAGVWGDGADSNVVPLNAGVIGTADNNSGGIFQNNSAYFSTITADNTNTGTFGTLFSNLQASGLGGTCGMGGGNLTCTGQMKSLVTSADGARKVETYAMQSPENWMEDFGSGEVQGGSGSVTLDPAFAETISASTEYRVFLTPTGDSKGLYVTSKTATGFEVHEAGGGTASISFDYRIVAKRRGMEAQRLTDVTDKFNAETKRPLLRNNAAKK